MWSAHNPWGFLSWCIYHFYSARILYSDLQSFLSDLQNFLNKPVFTQNFFWFIPCLKVIIWSDSNFEKVLCVTNTNLSNTKLQVSSNSSDMQNASTKWQFEKLWARHICLFDKWTTLFPVLVLFLKQKTMFSAEKTRWFFHINQQKYDTKKILFCLKTEG